MNESSWQECIEFNSAIKVSIDKPKARSLMQMAAERIRFLDTIRQNEQNISFIFESYYSSALEMLHALVLLNGYKILNHICLGFYLRDYFGRQDLYRLFDDSRVKRNNIVYYAKKLTPGSAKESIQKIGIFVKEIGLLIDEHLK